MSCQNGNMRSFRSTNFTVSTAVNEFLGRCSSKVSGYDPKVAFSKAGNSDRSTELFLESRLHGMLKVPDFDTAENVFPFFDSHLDAL